MKIMLDAGHGYDTPGKRSPDGMREYDFSRAVANYAKKLLESYLNVTVYFTHSDKRDVPLTERTNKANQLKADVFISIHANANGSDWNNAHGIETYVYLSKQKTAYELSKKIQKNLVISTGLTDRGVKTANFHVLRETDMPAVLAECGFMTNRNEAKLLRSDTFRKTCAEAIVKSIAGQYKLIKKQTKAEKSAANKTKPSGQHIKTTRQHGLYKVQAGAFKEKTSAEKLAKALKKDGYDPFIYFE